MMVLNLDDVVEGLLYGFQGDLADCFFCEDSDLLHCEVHIVVSHITFDDAPQHFNRIEFTVVGRPAEHIMPSLSDSLVGCVALDQRPFRPTSL